MVKIRYANNRDKLHSALKELNKTQVLHKNLHEIRNEILGDFTGEFEMIGKLSVGDQIGTTHIRFRNITEYEEFIISIDDGYDAEDSIFNGYIYKINTPLFNLVNRSQYRNGCDFKHKIIDYQGNSCFIPRKGYSFIKCINILTGGDYKQQYLDFIRNEKRISKIMVSARIQPCLRKLGVNLGYYNGKEICPTTITNRNISLFLSNNHFCLIWKPEGVSFNQAIKELKDNFKIVDNYITEEKVNSHFKYDFIPQKTESHLTNFFLYDLETHTTDRLRPYRISFYRSSKLAGRCNRVLTPYEIDKCKKDTLVFVGDDCITKALDFCLKLKGEERRASPNNKSVEYSFQLHAHNGSGFDTWIILNNFPCDKHIVVIIKKIKV